MWHWYDAACSQITLSNLVIAIIIITLIQSDIHTNYWSNKASIRSNVSSHGSPAVNKERMRPVCDFPVLRESFSAFNTVGWLDDGKASELYKTASAPFNSKVLTKNKKRNKTYGRWLTFRFINKTTVKSSE